MAHLNFGRRLVDEGKLAATIIQLSSGGPAVDWAARVLPLTPYPPTAQLSPLSA